MIFIKLFYEFFIVGLFAVGGGLATIPFLASMGENSGWFTLADLTNMVAISEATPGPLGVNMATYVGFSVAGTGGALAAVMGLITPSLVIILIISAFLHKFRHNQQIEAIFHGLRPASTALIAAAAISVITMSLVTIERPAGGPFWAIDGLTWHLPAIILAAAILLLTHLPKVQKLHPVVWLACSAAIGIIFEL